MTGTLISCPRCRSLVQAGPEACCPSCGAELIRPAEAPDASLWYYAANQEKKGPISWTELARLVRTGGLGPADMVLPAGAQQWQPARSVPGLADTSHDSFPPMAEPPLAESGLPSLFQAPAREPLPPTIDPTPPGAGPSADNFLGQVGLPTVPGYEIMAELGRGGMGVVYKAKQVQLKRVVALKMILAGDYADGEARTRFRAEAESVARLQHPNIVQVHEIGEHDDKPYFSLEYVSGGSLHDQVDGPQPPRQAAELVRILAQAMHAAHAVGIVHRDLKPGNILLQPATDGTAASAWGIPKISDFGLAKQLDMEARTRSGDVLGTPQYMAPEQARGRVSEVGPWADIYALGAILYELLTGRPPFRGESTMDTLLLVVETEPVPPRRFQPSVPADLETICLKCLEKQPGQRYPTSAALAEDLQRFLGDQPIVARPVGRAERLMKWARRRPAIASLLAAVLLVGLLGLGGIVWQWRDAVVARADADWQRGVAEGETVRAKTALADAENRLYFYRVALAHHEWRFLDIGLARELLDECPPAPRDWEWRYLRRLFHPELATIPGNGESLMHLAFSPDGRYLATAGSQATVTIYDADSRKELAHCRGHTGPVRRVAFSPDGKLLASGGQDKSVRLWQVPSGQPVRNLGEHRIAVQGLSFHPDGKKLASAGGDIKATEIASGKVLMQYDPPKNDYQCIAYHPNGEQVAAVGDRTTIHVWEVKTGKPTSWRPGHDGTIHELAWSPDGKWLATSSSDETVELHDTASGKVAHSLRGGSGELGNVVFSLDSQRVAAACGDSTVLVWELSPEMPVILRGHTGPVHAVAVPRDGRQLASVGADGTIRFWDLRTDPEMHVLRGDKVVSGVAFSPDRRFLVYISEETVRVCDRQTREVVRVLKSPELDLAKALAISADSRFLAVGGRSFGGNQPPGVVVVWELGTGQPVQLFRVAERYVNCLAFAPDGTLFAGNGQWFFEKEKARKNLPILGWNVATGQEIVGLPRTMGGAVAFAVSPDGRLLAMGGIDQVVRLWDLKLAKEIGALTGHQGEVTSVAFHSGGKLLASASRDRTIKLWDLSTSQVVRTLRGHTSHVGGVAFSPDGRRLASAGFDSHVKLWDTATGQDVLTLSRHHGAVNTVAFSPDGHFLASGSYDETLLLWHAP